MYGIPDAEEADDHHRNKDEDDIPGVDADGIGIDDERAFRLAESDNAVGLLYPAEQQAKHDACYGSDDTDHTTFKKEDTCNLTVGSSQIVERDDIVALVDDESRNLPSGAAPAKKDDPAGRTAGV